MANKPSTVVLKVDLDCPKCYKKVRKALCKFNEIQSWSLDEKQKKVIISGTFNPECLVKKLYCKVGCKIIKGHEIILPKPPPPPKEAEPPKKPDPPPPKVAEPPKKPDPPPPKEAEPPKKPDAPPPKKPDPAPPKEAEPPKKPDPAPPKEAEPPKKPDPPKKPPPPPEPVYVGPVYVGPPGPICCCCCRPCFQGRGWDGYCTRERGGYYDTCCRDCYEGRPWDGPCTRGGYDSGYRFFSDEDSCRTM